MNRRFLWVFLAVWGCWGMSAGAEEGWIGDKLPATEAIAVQDYGDLTKLEIDGNNHFTDSDIREELVEHVRLQAACRPSSKLVPLIDLLQEVLEEAYRQSGCPDAKVAVSPAENRPVLRAVVDEGTRYAAGAVLVRGVEPELADTLTQHLTTSKSRSPVRKGVSLTRGSTQMDREGSSDQLWVSGEPVRASEHHRAQVKRALVDELAIVGYPLAKLELEVAPDAGGGQIANLVVNVTELGPRARLDVVEMEASFT